MQLEKPSVLEDWLQKNFRKEKTKKNYRVALKTFREAVYGKDVIIGIEHYFSENRNFLEDVKLFCRFMNESQLTPGSMHCYLSVSKKFFSRHGKKLEPEEWDDIQKLLLPPNVVSIQDKILTKDQIKKTIERLYIHHKAIILFLVSSGCRIGETLQLTINDLELDHDPPMVHIRAQYTKKGVGGRVMWFSYEARDAIKTWLNEKGNIKKRGSGEAYSRDLVFPIGYISVQMAWNKALRKAGLGKRDPTTRRALYHIHTLRKFFRTQMGEANVPESIIHAWMGHKAYLDDAYTRYSEEKLAQIYKENMDAVTIYEHGSVDVKSFLDELEAKTKQIKELQENESFVYGLLEKYAIKNDRSLKDRLIDLVIKLQTPIEPQPIKSEPITPIPATQKPSVMSEHKEVEKPKEIPEQPIPKLKVEDDLVWCPTKEDWIHNKECGQCKFPLFSDCFNAKNRMRLGRATDQDIALHTPNKPKPQ